MRTSNNLFTLLFMTIYFALCSLPVFSQKEQKVKLDYIYYASPNEGVKTAKEKAFEAAKLEAIGREFGTIISSSTSSVMASKQMDDGSLKETDDFIMLSSSDVRGEWIETTKEPEYEVSMGGDALKVHIVAEGRIREIVAAKIDFRTRVLRNGTEDKFESDNFYNGDDMFVSFVSPVSGYLSIYLVDNSQEVYCILPYQTETDGSYPIEANKRHVLFSMKDETSPALKNAVDEIVVTADDNIERNQLYIIFSPNKYVKATDKESGVNNDGLQLPRQLNNHQFQKWISSCRKHDKDMVIQKKLLTIRKREN